MTVNKSITLESLKLENIKGIKNITLNFLEKKAYKFPNGFGKSTILDSILWLLTGQNDMFARKFDPETKPEKLGNILAELVINVDGKVITLKIAEHGKSLKYFIDGAPVGKEIYVVKLQELFGLSDLQLLFNPRYILEYLTPEEGRLLISKYLPTASEEDITNIQHKYKNDIGWQRAFDTDFNKAALKFELDDAKTKSLSLNNLSVVATDTKIVDVTTLQADLEKYIKEEAELKEEETFLREKIKADNLEAQENIDKWKAVLTHSTKLAAEALTVEEKAVSARNTYKRLTADAIKAYADLKSHCDSCGSALSETQISDRKHALEQKLTPILKAANEEKINAEEAVATFDKRDDVQHWRNDIVFKNNNAQLLANIETEKEKILSQTQQREVYNISTSLTEVMIKIREIQAELAAIKPVDTSLIETQKKENANLILELESAIKICDGVSRDITANTIQQLSNLFGQKLGIVLETTLKNGTIKPTFQIYYQNLAYRDLNTAHKMIASIEFVLGIQRLVGKTAPILLDNVESADEYSKKLINELTNNNIITMEVGE